MFYITIVFTIIISILVYIMFKVLKKTIKRVNEQTKTFFVDKLQVYDDLIEEKEKKLKEINEKIENKKAELKSLSDTSSNKNYIFDKSIIDIMSDADYKQSFFNEMQKKIDNDFDFDFEKIILNFIDNNLDDTKYKILSSIKKKFNSKTIYEINNELNLEKAIIDLLTDKQQPVITEYKKNHKLKKLDDFLNYIDEQISIESPYIEVQVASKKQNYNHLSKYINTTVNDSIYKGIKIIYKNKVYDFSLNERNV